MLVGAFAEAHRLKREQRNQELWLQGLYIYDALNTTATNVLQSMSKKRRKPVNYLEEPIRLTPLSEAEREQKAAAERCKVIEYFNRLEKSWKNKVPSANVPSAKE